MKRALELAIANLSEKEKAEARQELEQIIAVANSTVAHMGFRQNDCGSRRLKTPTKYRICGFDANWCNECH
jgi:hypothetical protein